MKTHYIIPFLLSLSIGFSSCKKEKVEDPLDENTPVFSATGTIGTESFSVHAGLDNFFMNTSSNSVNGVDFYSGKLGDGNFELEMGIYDGNIDINSSNFYQELPENLSFAMEPLEPLAFLSKDLLPNNMFIEEIKWYIDGLFAGLNNVTISKPGKYNVCALVTFTDGTYGNLCNEMILGYTENASCQILHYLTPEGELQVWVEEDQELVQTVKWFVDGQFVSDDTELMYSTDEENHTVKAEIVFQNGVQRVKSILIDGSLSGKFIDDFTVFENSANAVSWDFRAYISLKKDGKQYISSNTPNQLSSVHILSITYFGKNSAGKSVFKIIVDVSCQLKEISTNEILPFICSTEFGIEID